MPKQATAKLTPKVQTSQPVNFLQKPLKVDFKELFKVLGKSTIHGVTGKWEELAKDTVDAVAAIGLTTEPGELAFLLIRRSLTRALFDLIAESASQTRSETEYDENELIESLDFSASLTDIHIDSRFIDRPGAIPIIPIAQRLLQSWLEAHSVTVISATSIASRLSSYFVFALNQEWRSNAKSYAALREALETPFTKAGEREWAWATYTACLQKRIEEGLFNESFSLSQIYIPLNAWYPERPARQDTLGKADPSEYKIRKIVVPLLAELDAWLDSPDRNDTIRVISGGPGSGKSSFARIFAAHVAVQGRFKVLFVQLHLMDAGRDFISEIGDLVKSEGTLLQNPLDLDSPEPNLLIILDGLDELSSQGKAAAETAKNFVAEVDRVVERRNSSNCRLRILFSGRELVVQESESEFRRARQILTLLPYYSPTEMPKTAPAQSKEFDDANGLLSIDLRQTWWKRYGELTGEPLDGLPPVLNREDLAEITAQPLLNYLLALSYTRKQIDFSQTVNLNAIYADLIGRVHERAYQNRWKPMGDMKSENFMRVLEVIGLATWHGDGRTTTVREIENYCQVSGVSSLLKEFKEGAEAGVTNLLAAFFFRKQGQRSSGDATFVFTHKSFGEYLASRRIMRAALRIAEELEDRERNPDKGWNEKEALKHWAQICGPSPVSPYIHNFLLNEAQSRPMDVCRKQQSYLARLFSYMLCHGMPMEQLQLATFKIELDQARNAEETLLASLNSFARVTGEASLIEHPDPTTFGTWLKRIQGQRNTVNLVPSVLSFLKLESCNLTLSDMWDADLSFSGMKNSSLLFANLRHANLANAKLAHAKLVSANFINADLTRADLTHANLTGANLTNAKLACANLTNANLTNADLTYTKLAHAELIHANLTNARLFYTDLTDADLTGANLRSVRYHGVTASKEVLALLKAHGKDPQG
jgi:uncharacterized protein YjbI with pentapeptide repeats